MCTTEGKRCKCLFLCPYLLGVPLIHCLIAVFPKEEEDLEIYCPVEPSGFRWLLRGLKNGVWAVAAVGWAVSCRSRNGYRKKSPNEIWAAVLCPSERDETACSNGLFDIFWRGGHASVVIMVGRAGSR